jgi:hypothetical protein
MKTRVIVTVLIMLALWSGITGHSVQAANTVLPSAFSVNTEQVVAANFIIAASNSSAADKSQANIVCDGTADNVEIQNALVSNRVIQLTSGRFNLSGMINLESLTNVTISGASGTVFYSSTECFYIISSNNIVIQGINISRTDSDVNGCLVYILGSSGITLQNNIFHDFYKGVYIRSNNVNHTKSSNIKIINNEFYNYHYSCVMIGNGSEYVDVNDNVMHDGSIGLYSGTLYAISTETIGEWDTLAPMAEWVNIERNHIYNQTTHNAIDVHGGNYIRIVDNQIENIANMAIFAHLFRSVGFTGVTNNTDWTISGNTIQNVNAGILISNADTNATISAVDITSNTINNLIDTGIFIYSVGSGSLVEGININSNILAGHPGNNPSGYGIKCYADDSVGAAIANVSITDNTLDARGDIYNLRTGIYTHYSRDTLISGNTVKYPWENSVLAWISDRVIISGNNLVDSRYGVELIHEVDAQILNNRITATIPIGIDDSYCVNTQVIGNNWQGSMEDMRYSAAVNPTISNNLDRNGNPYLEVNPVLPDVNYIVIVPSSYVPASGFVNLSNTTNSEAINGGSVAYLLIPKGGNVGFIAQAYDSNNNPISGLSYKWSVANNEAGVISSGGLFTAGTVLGSYPDVIEASTSGGIVGKTSINVIESPFAALGNQTINEGQLLEFKVSSDLDQTGLTFAASNLPSGASFDPFTQIFSFTPTLNQSGSYPNVTFEATNGIFVDSQSLTITVIDANHAPVLDPIGNKKVKVASRLSFTVSASDADGDRLTYTASNLPAGATFNTSTRVFSWTPTKSQVGSYSNVRFKVTDGKLVSSETITITVASTNHAPVISMSNQIVSAGTLLEFTVSASDSDQDSLTYSALNLPSGASFNIETRKFSWTPTLAQKGIFSNVRFSVTDGIATTTKNISITVRGPNQAPVLSSISNKTVKAGTLLSFTINGTDPDGNKLTYSALNLPAGATFNSTKRTFSWKPNSSQIGTYSNIMFKVSDGSLTGSRSVIITVK